MGHPDPLLPTARQAMNKSLQAVARLQQAEDGIGRLMEFFRVKLRNEGVPNPSPEDVLWRLQSDVHGKRALYEWSMAQDAARTYSGVASALLLEELLTVLDELPGRVR